MKIDNWNELYMYIKPANLPPVRLDMFMDYERSKKLWTYGYRRKSNYARIKTSDFSYKEILYEAGIKGIDLKWFIEPGINHALIRACRLKELVEVYPAYSIEDLKKDLDLGPEDNFCKWMGSNRLITKNRHVFITRTDLPCTFEEFDSPCEDIPKQFIFNTEDIFIHENIKRPIDAWFDVFIHCVQNKFIRTTNMDYLYLEHHQNNIYIK